MERYLNFVERYARAIVFVLVAITAYFTYTLGSLMSDTNPYLLKESHPARKTIIDLQHEFTGTYDSVMVAQSNAHSVFNTQSLNAQFEISQALRRLMLANADDEVELRRVVGQHEDDSRTQLLASDILAGGFNQNDYAQAKALRDHAHSQGWAERDQQFLTFLAERINPIQEMASMADLENISLSADGELWIHKTLHGLDMNPQVVEAQIMGNEQMVGGVVSPDKKVAVVVAELGTKQDDAQAQLRAYQQVRQIVADYQSKHPQFTDEVFIAGTPIFIAAQQEIIDHDLALLFPIVFLLVTSMLVFFFRKPLGVFLPLFNILFCTIWTLGLMALLKVPIDLLTSVLPVFLFTICCADAIHVMAEYYEQLNAGKTYREANRETMRRMVVPVVLTTVTTIATFMISTTNNIVSIRNFGVFMSIGLTAALIISLLLIPAWISIWGKDQPPRKTVHKESIISRYLVAFCARLIRWRKPVLLVSLPLLALMTVFTFMVDIEDSGIAYFKKDSPVRVSDEFINRSRIAGTSPGWIAFDTKTPRGALTTETVQFLDKLDHFLKSQPNVSYTYSVAAYVKRMNLVLNDMNPDYLRVPQALEQVTSLNDGGQVETFEVDGNALIEQHIMMFENGGGSDLQNVLNADYSKALTLYTMTSSVASDYKAMLDRLDAWLLVNKPANLQVTHAGTPKIWTGILAEITQGQVLSFSLALLVVTLMMMFWLKSVRLGILGMLTLLTTSVTVYGFMYLLGIELNIGTTLVTFLVVGVVDYAVHLLSRIKLLVQQGIHVDEAILTAMHSVGRSTVVNVVIFSVGFLALLFSAYKPVIDLGTLVALALFSSGVMTILLVTLISPWFFAAIVPEQRADEREHPEREAALS
ncbi:MMPL family transporter [Pseudomonas sp. SH10-3B]|uniref:efflux RND transporter permease subunit n=1 Tax=Pseudomonas sp. SH10-3B TaxID=2816049 RepID=UPI001CA66CE9|nr:MMPL family transporter [Pseudomonas sp. SH10-3B]MBY8948450.1 MMPL family transporter [Pseudomonas sp. SH10-3B]